MLARWNSQLRARLNFTCWWNGAHKRWPRVIRWRHRYWPDKNPSWANTPEHVSFARVLYAPLTSCINRHFFLHAYACARIVTHEINGLVRHGSSTVVRLIQIVSSRIKEPTVIWLPFSPSLTTLSFFLSMHSNILTMEIVGNSENISVTRYWRETTSRRAHRHGFRDRKLRDTLL